MSILWQWLFPEKENVITFTKFVESSPLALPFKYTALYQYSDSLRQALHEIKFKNNRHYLDQIGLQLIKDFKPDNIDLLIPVPIHPQRLNERGFDHTYELTRKFAYFHKIPINTNIVYRSINTKHMYELNPQDRRAEVDDSFAIWENMAKTLKGKNVLLFDDIITTGNTLLAVYNAIIKYQPKSVIALGITRPSFQQ